MSNEQRYKRIFKSLYEFMMRYEGKPLTTIEEWQAVADDIRSCVDYKDMFSTKMAVACYTELADQRKKVEK